MDVLMPLTSSPWLFVVVVVVVALDGFVPVVPSEAMVIGLGAVSVSGSPNLLALFAAVVAGGVVGDRIAYLIGSRAGGRFATGRLAPAREKAARALLRHGGAAIIVGRFLPYGRTATTVMSGAAALPMGRFHLFTAVSSVAWAVYVIGLGRLGGAAFADAPLWGAALGVAFGMVLATLWAVGEKRRSVAEAPC
ncbi:DedA family protein [Actinoplanes rectilineatus]|uniref:DedA family protein n=1 Tax=Actinoplanes rectilineatus TaxID=113571 RepID=UPI0007C69012|nr:VTT domain-containing protein [Actinoplanes rectilineatus]